MSVTRIELPELPAPVDRLWDVLLDLHESLTHRWTLVGGQMVLLHALEHGHVPPQISQDGDVLADLRAAPNGISAIVTALESVGFKVDGISPDGVAHRFVRDAEPRAIAVDLLAPDGMGARADLSTSRPGRTIQVPGGTQALQRTEDVTVVHRNRVGEIPRPSLLAALVLKGAACGIPGDDPARHLRDLALLCSLVEDPFAIRSELSKKDGTRLREAQALLAPDHLAWSLAPAETRQAGREAFRILIDDPR